MGFETNSVENSNKQSEDEQTSSKVSTPDEIELEETLLNIETTLREFNQSFSTQIGNSQISAESQTTPGQNELATTTSDIIQPNIQHFLQEIIHLVKKADVGQKPNGAKRVIFVASADQIPADKKNKQYKILDSKILALLPENIRLHAQEKGIRVSSFSENYHRVLKLKDIENRLRSIIEKGVLPYLSEAERVEVKKSEFLLNYIDKIKDLPNADILQYLQDHPGESFDKKKLKTFYAELIGFIKKTFMPDLIEKIAVSKLTNETSTGINHTEKLADKLYAILNSEINAISEEAGQLIINIDEHKHISCAFPYTLNEKKKPQLLSPYKRDTALANAYLHIDAQKDDQEKVQVLTQTFRHANADPYDLVNPQARFEGTIDNLLEWVKGATEIAICGNSTALKGLGTEENPYIISFADISLLSMGVELADHFDPQDARQQVLNLYNAALAITHTKEPFKFELANYGVIYVKPKISVHNLPVNTMRYFTGDDAVMVQNAGFINLFAKVADEIVGKITKDDVKKLTTLLTEIFNPNENKKFQALKDERVALHTRYKEACEKLKGCGNITEALNDMYVLQADQNFLDAELIAFYRKRFLACKDKFKNELDSKKQVIMNGAQHLLEEYNFAVNIFNILDLLFTQSSTDKFMQSSMRIAAELAAYVDNQAIAGLGKQISKSQDPKFNGLLAVEVSELLTKLGCITKIGCNDAKDRAGAIFSLKASAQIYANANKDFPGMRPCYDNQKDLEGVKQLQSHQLETNASLAVTKRSGSIGYETHKRDGLGTKSSLQPKLAKEPLKEAHQAKHLGGWRGFIASLKKADSEKSNRSQSWLFKLIIMPVFSFFLTLAVGNANDSANAMTSPVTTAVSTNGVVNNTSSGSTRDEITAGQNTDESQPTKSKGTTDDGSGPLPASSTMKSDKDDEKESSDLNNEVEWKKSTDTTQATNSAVVGLMKVASGPAKQSPNQLTNNNSLNENSLDKNPLYRLTRGRT